MAFKDPEASELASMINMILGADASAAVASGVDASSMSHTAMYVDDEGKEVATCRCALPTAAALGCALSMIPPGGAEAMVEDNELSQMATDNLYEVMNMFSSLLMDDKSSHLKLVSVDASNDESIQGSSFEFDIDLGNYGQGQLMFNVA